MALQLQARPGDVGFLVTVDDLRKDPRRGTWSMRGSVGPSELAPSHSLAARQRALRGLTIGPLAPMRRQRSRSLPTRRRDNRPAVLRCVAGRRCIVELAWVEVGTQGLHFGCFRKVPDGAKPLPTDAVNKVLPRFDTKSWQITQTFNSAGYPRVIMPRDQGVTPPPAPRQGGAKAAGAKEAAVSDEALAPTFSVVLSANMMQVGVAGSCVTREPHVMTGTRDRSLRSDRPRCHRTPHF